MTKISWYVILARLASLFNLIAPCRTCVMSVGQITVDLSCILNSFLFVLLHICS